MDIAGLIEQIWAIFGSLSFEISFVVMTGQQEC